MSRRGRQLQGASRMSAACRKTGDTFQGPGDTASVAQISEQLQGFAVGAVGGFEITLSAIAVSEIGLRARCAPAIASLQEDFKRALIELERSAKVALFTRDVALLIQRPGGAAAVTEFFEDVACFAQGGLASSVVAANLGDVGKIVQTARGREIIGELAPASETALEVELCGLVVAAIAGRDAKRIERSSDPGKILELLVDAKALVEEASCRGEISLSGRQRTEEDVQLRTLFGVSLSGERQYGFKAGAAFGEVLAHVPKTKQRHAQTQSPIEVACLEQPIEGGTEVVDLEFAAGEPEISRLGNELGIAFFREHQTVGGMSAPSCRFFSAGRETLVRIFTNRLQHREARFIVWLFDPLYKILVDERREAFEQVHAEIETGIADGFC